METFIKNYFNQIKIGKDERFEGFQVFPLFSDSDYGVEYLMMKEALDKGVLIVTEVSSSGDVNKLTAVNKSDLPILLLGGEELEGAKQNRILNTSILLPPNEETIIPVNCVESGRWAYKSKKFKESGNLAYRKMRKSSYEELYDSDNYEVRQHRTWDEVDDFSRRMSIDSSTSAMKDIYDAKSEEFSDYLSKITFHENQIGLIAVSSGRILGFDIIGRSDKFSIVFKKLLTSYIAEDMISEIKKKSFLKKEGIRGFFDKVVKTKEKRMDGVGLGYEYRYNSNDVVGSALSYKSEIIHSVFFGKDSKEDKKEDNYGNDRFSSYNVRRTYLD